MLHGDSHAVYAGQLLGAFDVQQPRRSTRLLYPRQCGLGLGQHPGSSCMYCWLFHPDDAPIPCWWAT